jgi:hypothetical protein
VGLWLLITIYLIGYLDVDWIPSIIKKLGLPASTAELGDSLGLLNGLLSGLTVIFALIAVLIQGKELRNTSKAQQLQATVLIEQLKQQEVSNHLNVLSVRLQFLLSEISRMDLILNNINGQMEKGELFNNCSAKKKRHIEEAEFIDNQMKSLLN